MRYFDYQAVNLFGTMDRSRFIFRSTLKWVKRLIEIKADPAGYLRAPWKALGIANIAVNTLPKKVRSGPVLDGHPLPAVETGVAVNGSALGLGIW